MTNPRDQINPSLPVLPNAFLHNFVSSFFEQKQVYLKAVEQFGSPLYILETSVLKDRARQFKTAFENKLPNTFFYYAMKSNNLPEISETLLAQGFGIDVSSGIELACALALKATDIIFSGPGKTDAELEMAVANADTTTLLIDSVGEFKRLAGIPAPKESNLRVGVRLNNNPAGLWRKFGVLPETLPDLYRDIKNHPQLVFSGLQFHSSWNLTPARQIEFIETLGKQLEKMPGAFLNSLKFIDIGGGYWPPQGEWILSNDNHLQHFREPSTPIEEFAERLSETIKKKILSLVDCRICFEPGRWLCNDAMQILIRVTDKKAPDLVITDAGTNAVGWERFETDYFPVLNLTRPDMTETPCHILGSLCTPHDVWGYAYFGQDIKEGDILLIPTQGAYTYSLRQNFIKSLPRVVIFDGSSGSMVLKSE